MNPLFEQLVLHFFEDVGLAIIVADAIGYYDENGMTIERTNTGYMLVGKGYMVHS